MRRWGMLVLGVGLGGLLALGILFDRTGRDVAGRLKGLVAPGAEESQAPDYGNWFSHGDDAYRPPAWAAVVSPTSPQWKVRRGFDVERVATGFEYPVNLVFKVDPTEAPDAILYYVNELHGTIKTVHRDGSQGVFAEDLINYEPLHNNVKSDETGISGMTAVPGSEDLIVTGAYLDPRSGLLKNRVMRLVAEPGGRRMARMEVLLDLDEYTSPSNQIQQALFGPDGKLYISVGDAENYHLPLDRNKFGGKILRMELDGSACVDNPFFDRNRPTAPESYVFCYGVRNVFDIDLDPVGGGMMGVDNGESIDRLFALRSGASYTWDGDPETTRANALFSWGPHNNLAPVGMAFLHRNTLGEGTRGRLYIATYGPPAARGPNQSKSILECELDSRHRLLLRSPQPLIQYVGEERATVLGLAEGPDGLYFTDFFGEVPDATTENQLASRSAGSIWRVFPSDATLDLPTVVEADLAAMDPLERGRVRFLQNCSPCHTVDGYGGHEGPELTRAYANLDRRLHTVAYESQVRELLEAEGSFQVEQRPRLEEILAVEGDERIRIWLEHHLAEPRFDHPFAKMPSFDVLGKSERDEIIGFLMSRRETGGEPPAH